MPKPGEERAAAAVAALPGAVYTPFDLSQQAGSALPAPRRRHLARARSRARAWRTCARREHPRACTATARRRASPPLVDAIVEKLRDAEPARRRARAGARDGRRDLGPRVRRRRRSRDPGEEVLILRAVLAADPRHRALAARGARRGAVLRPRARRGDDAVAALEARRTPRSVALYFSNPSNPTGRVLPPRRGSRRSRSWARRHDLWLLSDEVYEDYVYRGEHVSIARFAPERTLTVFSFSKAYGMAGNRVGYLAGPRGGDRRGPQGLGALEPTTRRRPRSSRRCARSRAATAWVKRARESTRASAREAAALLGAAAPEGSMLPVRRRRARGSTRAACRASSRTASRDGVVVAPGASSGEAYGSWVRLCYTALPPDAALEGVRRLARRLGRLGGAAATSCASRSDHDVGLAGTSWWPPFEPVGTAAILSTTSMPFDHLAEHGVAEGRGPGRSGSGSRCPSRLMKNCAVALSTTLVRAIAIVPRSFFRPLSASFLIGARVGFCVDVRRRSRRPGS